MTERWEAASPNGSNGRDALASAADEAVAIAGPSGTRSVAASRAGRSIAAVLALRPAATPPPPGDPVLVGAGDIASCAGTGDDATADLLDTIPGTVFTLGDNVYPDGTGAEYANCYDPTWGRHKDRTMPVPGNHDYRTAGASGYYDYFGAAAGDPTKGYYDYTVGAWHVIVLNGNCGEVGGCGPGSAQEQWLRSVLAASNAECTVAMWHQPLFSSARNHGSNLLYRPFWQALYEYGADVVLGGHDHDYERFGLQTPDGVADPLYGLREFVVGTGGNSHYGFGPALPNSEVRNGDTYGVLQLTLHPGSYEWRFVPEAGRTFTDSGTTGCHGAPPLTPPPASGPITPLGHTSSGSSTSRNHLTLDRPAGTRAGDVMVASIVSNDDTPGFSAPAGWTLVRDDWIVDALRQAVYVKVAGPSEPGSYTWTLSDYRRLAGGIATYRGVDTAHPVDVQAGSVHSGAATAVTAPTLTTTVAGTMLVDLSAVNAEGTLAPPAGMTERWEAASPNGSNGRDALASAADALQAGAGATGTRTTTASRAGRSIGAVLALRPATPDEPPPPVGDVIDTVAGTGAAGFGGDGGPATAARV
ncbi:MAG TPA: metallophosphoesterase, partial [Acidimicrobiia bacterium]|nr:metallophosphoesterase [Acidimicrobiia bacterium]